MNKVNEKVIKKIKEWKKPEVRAKKIKSCLICTSLTELLIPRKKVLAEQPIRMLLQSDQTVLNYEAIRA